MKGKNIISLVVIGVLTVGLLACGSVNKPVIGDKAAARGIEEANTGYFIDDGAIALSSYAASSKETKEAVTALYQLFNTNRAQNGIKKLDWSDDLADAAMVRAKELEKDFSHTRPDGSQYWTVNGSKVYAENTAKFYVSAEDLYNAWMKDESHNANIMNKNYDAVGIAICQTNDGKWYWIAEFGKK